MEKEHKTQEQWYIEVGDLFKDTPREAIRYYNIETLPRYLYVLDIERHSCVFCNNQFEYIYRNKQYIGQWVRNDSPEMKSFQSELQQGLAHLKQAHNIYPKGLWLSRLTVVGIVAGLILAFVFSYLYEEIELHEFLFLGAASGMILGWVSGKVKETVLGKNNQLF